MMIRRMFFSVIPALLVLSACGKPPELEKTVDPIGDFRMGFNVVVANDVQKGPVSRDATEEELTSAIRDAMEERLGRYNGDGLYHIGLRVEAYALGRAGIPIVFSPRSVFLIAMNIWDDATQKKLNDEPIRVTAFDGAAGPLVGGGLVRNRETQIKGLAFDAARQVEKILKENEDAWFGPKEGRERIEFRRDPKTGLQMAGDGTESVNPAATGDSPDAEAGGTAQSDAVPDAAPAAATEDAG